MPRSSFIFIAVFASTWLSVLYFSLLIPFHPALRFFSPCHTFKRFENLSARKNFSGERWLGGLPRKGETEGNATGRPSRGWEALREWRKRRKWKRICGGKTVNVFLFLSISFIRFLESKRCFCSFLLFHLSFFGLGRNFLDIRRRNCSFALFLFFFFFRSILLCLIDDIDAPFFVVGELNGSRFRERKKKSSTAKKRNRWRRERRKSAIALCNCGAAFAKWKWIRRWVNDSPRTCDGCKARRETSCCEISFGWR